MPKTVKHNTDRDCIKSGHTKKRVKIKQYLIRFGMSSVLSLCMQHSMPERFVSGAAHRLQMVWCDRSQFLFYTIQHIYFSTIHRWCPPCVDCAYAYIVTFHHPFRYKIYYCLHVTRIVKMIQINQPSVLCVLLLVFSFVPAVNWWLMGQLIQPSKYDEWWIHTAHETPLQISSFYNFGYE